MATKILNYYEENKNLPHTSAFHAETYYEHVMLVTAEALKVDAENRKLVLSAALHDIAKPRTQSFNKMGGACFYDHEKITREELARFLSPSYNEFEEILLLIQAHMLPYHAEGVEPFASKAKERLQQIKKEKGEAFYSTLMKLHECDKAGTIRPGSSKEFSEDVKKAELWFLSEKTLL